MDGDIGSILKLLADAVETGGNVDSGAVKERRSHWQADHDKLFNSAKYAAMKGSHLDFYPNGVAANSGVHRGVDIPGPNYAQLVGPFRGHGERVEDPAQLKPALETALEAVNSGYRAILDVVLSA